MKEQKYVVVTVETDGSSFYCCEPTTENNIIKECENMRKGFLEDDVDEDYINSFFPTPISTFEEAEKWYAEFDTVIAEVRETEAIRILKRMLDRDISITGTAESTNSNEARQGYWNFQIKIIDLDNSQDNMVAKIQLSARKMCPSGLSDNGIELNVRTKVSLYQFDEIEDFVKFTVKNFLREKRTDALQKVKTFKVN